MDQLRDRGTATDPCLLAPLRGVRSYFSSSANLQVYLGFKRYNFGKEKAYNFNELSIILCLFFEISIIFIELSILYKKSYVTRPKKAKSSEKI